MATMQVQGTTIELKLSRAEKVAALHGDITIAVRDVEDVEVVQDGLAVLPALRHPGLALPGGSHVGTFGTGDQRTFAALHGHGPALRLHLRSGSDYRTVLVGGDPELEVAALAETVRRAVEVTGR